MEWQDTDKVGRFYLADYNELTIMDINKMIEEGTDMPFGCLDPEIQKLIMDSGLTPESFRKA